MARSRRPTRDDVAARAGVSSAVVSYVLNGGPRPVANDKRERVLAAVEELGYLPNEIARSLAGQSTRSIGLITPTLVNPVWATLAMGVTDVMGAREYLMIVCDVEEQSELEQRYAQMMVSKRVEGVILVPSAHTHKTVRILDRANVPVIVVEQDLEDASCVVVDGQETGYRATKHLLELGHTRIAILRERRSSLDSWKRYLGYELAMYEAGLDVDPLLIAEAAPSAEGSVVEGSLAAARALLSHAPTPTAVFAHNDLMAIAVVHQARDLGLRVPQDLSVVGVDDIDAGRYFDPPLTTVPFPARALGKQAASCLLHALAGDDAVHRTVIESPDLVVRGSTAPPSYQSAP